MLICCMCVKTKVANRLSTLSLVAEEPCLHSGLLISGDKSSHIIMFDFYFHQARSKAPFYIPVIFSRCFLIHPLLVSISIDPPFLSFLFFLFLYLILSPFSLSRAQLFVSLHQEGVHSGGPTASLSGVFAAVWLQLLGCDKEGKEEKFPH